MNVTDFNDPSEIDDFTTMMDLLLATATNLSNIAIFVLTKLGQALWHSTIVLYECSGLLLAVLLECAMLAGETLIAKTKLALDLLRVYVVKALYAALQWTLVEWSYIAVPFGLVLLIYLLYRGIRVLIFTENEAKNKAAAKKKKKKATVTFSSATTVAQT